MTVCGMCLGQHVPYSVSVGLGIPEGVLPGLQSREESAQERCRCQGHKARPGTRCAWTAPCAPLACGHVWVGALSFLLRLSPTPSHPELPPGREPAYVRPRPTLSKCGDGGQRMHAAPNTQESHMKPTTSKGSKFCPGARGPHLQAARKAGVRGGAPANSRADIVAGGELAQPRPPSPWQAARPPPGTARGASLTWRDFAGRCVARPGVRSVARVCHRNRPSPSPMTSGLGSQAAGTIGLLHPQEDRAGGKSSQALELCSRLWGAI